MTGMMPISALGCLILLVWSFGRAAARQMIPHHHAAPESPVSQKPSTGPGMDGLRYPSGFK